jgi:class 3 adenylate cyclase
VGTPVEVVLVVLVAVEGAGLLGLGILVLTGRRTRRRLRAKLEAERAAAAGAPLRRTARRLVPTPDEAVKAVFETVDRVREKGFGGALRSSIEELAGWAQVERPALVAMAGADGSVSILFSDIVGSTELNERMGDRPFVRMLQRHDAVVRSAIERHRGQVVKTQGDGFMAAFPAPGDAVRSAVAIQLAFEKGRRKGKAAVQLRIGIHHGDVVHRDNDIFGRNVALAARVAALAEGRQILVSEAVAAAVADCDDIVLVDPREVTLKGLAGEFIVSTVDWAA